MAKYELDLHIALIFLSEEEVEQLKTMVLPRQERFGECGLLETNINIFKVKEPTSSSKVALPEIPVTVNEIPSRTSTVEKDVDDIQWPENMGEAPFELWIGSIHEAVMTFPTGMGLGWGD